jgi:thiol-disulfide isomerase/thioredoxin
MRLLRFAGLIVSFALFGCKPTPNDIYNALPSLGGPVPAFHYVALDGSVLTSASLLGKPTVIALWSTTCSASRLALASIAALNAEYAGRGVRVVILADDRDSATVAATLARVREPLFVALAANSLMDTFTHGQSVLPWRKAFALPTFLVLNAGGKIVYRQIGIEQDSSQRLARVRGRLDSLTLRPAL